MRDIMRKEYKAYKKVGKLKNSIGELLELDFPEVVYASPGVIKHIKKRHGKQLTKKIKDNILETVETIIKEPDYFGISNKENMLKSIELIKKIDNIILLLGLEIDNVDDYVYVATLYPITICKMNSKIFKGELIKMGTSQEKEEVLLYN